MAFSWKKFVSTHSSILILIIYNIFALFIFSILYYICEKNINQSFHKSSSTNNNNSPIGFIDHFLLSVAVQSGVGMCSITPTTSLAKLIVGIQEFLVMSSTFVSIYIFIYFSKTIF